MQGSAVQFDFEDVSPVEKRLNVQVARELVTAKLDEAYRKLGKDVTLAGFRKGKAPRSLLEKIFGKKVNQDVANELINQAMMQLSQQHADLRFATTPILEGMPDPRRGEPMRFVARLELFPEIVPTDYEGLEVSVPATTVTDEQLDKQLEQRRREHMELHPITDRDRLAETDMVTVTLDGAIGSFRFDKQDVDVDLGTPERTSIPWLIPALIGLPKDATDVELPVTLPGQKAEGEQKPQTLRATIKKAHFKHLPALDDDFAKDTGDAETLAELRDKIRTQLQDEATEEHKSNVRMALVEELLKKNPVPLPPMMVNRVSEQLVEPHRRRAMFEALRDGRDPQTVDLNAVRSAAHEEAIRSLSVELVLLAVADKEKITVTDADVDARVAELAKANDKSVARVRAEMQKEDQGFQNLRLQLRVEKALDLLESRAKIS